MLLSRRSASLLAALLLPALAASCIESPEEIEFTELPCTFTFAFDTTQMTKTPSGLFYRDLSVGTGDIVASGSETYVHYTGWLANGTKFDQNLPSSAFPFGFPVGANAVIRGFDEGVQGMREGGCRQLVIPPALGYGTQPYGNIPGNSWLVFELGVAATL